LINFCIVPVEFTDPSDYDKIDPDDEVLINNLLKAIKDENQVSIVDVNGSFEFVGKLDLSNRERQILLSAGLLNYTRKKTRGE